MKRTRSFFFFKDRGYFIIAENLDFIVIYVCVYI